MDLPDADKRKVIGILGMLASEHDGERASAALLLTRMLAKHKLRPEELLNGKANGSSDTGMVDALLRENNQLKHARDGDIARVRRLMVERVELNRQVASLEAQLRAKEAPPPPPPQSHPWEAGYRTVREEITGLLGRQDIRWTDWEKEFLESIARWRGSLTAKQAEIFEKIRTKAKQQDAARKAAAGIWG